MAQATHKNRHTPESRAHWQTHFLSFLTFPNNNVNRMEEGWWYSLIKIYRYTFFCVSSFKDTHHTNTQIFLDSLFDIINGCMQIYIFSGSSISYVISVLSRKAHLTTTTAAATMYFLSLGWCAW